MADAELTNKERRKARKAERAKPQETATTKKRKSEAEPEVQQDADALTEERKEVSETSPAPNAESIDEDEEPPLSHKELRKRRKMEKSQAQKQGQSEPVKPSGPPKRSPFSVWIGNLSFTITSEDLTRWLSDHDITGISRVHMPSGVRSYENNKGFAFVDLPSQDQVASCVALSEQQLGGRRLLIKDGSDYTGRPGLDLSVTSNDSILGGGRTGLTKTAQRILHAQRNPPAPTLFVGNLSFETTEESIRELFEGSAQRRKKQDMDQDPSDDTENDPNLNASSAGIKKIRIGAFEDTGKCKGFAFIDFESIPKATQALVEPRNAQLLGRTLQLEYAGIDAVRRGASRNLLPDYVPTPRRRKSRLSESGEMINKSLPMDAREDSATHNDASGAPESNLLPSDTTPQRPSRKSRPPARVRPGAANAQAQRQHYAIQPASGKRTTFD
ncbi:Nucleolar protein 13 [Malassezia yamatoensis]|uniref:Nucleolar protein 13 n=1 Tax=Malassezia yamatoensis TaxID=253288 RepID=A0AAJ5YVX0_9BASI|nr:Nucleolar protein 13 [Malassezia yamatoensis]